ncbi:hypothetical protein Syun_005729 [Stephania yunnanensis]|uniref:Conserved oligomeric Golgi complex subunit 1 n=1 Tax=Stephania yunnanensis TaxID=152371 RepID=A0AAP0KVB4_9MAGN
MRLVASTTRSDESAGGGGGSRDAESLFRSNPISEIRNVEGATKKQIEEKKEELRQLVGNRYRDLIDSADSILLMKSSCHSISSNILLIETGIRSLAPSSAETPKFIPNPSRLRVYAIACRVKYLVDTPENIWGCLDESMFLEASGRYLRAKVVHGFLATNATDPDFLSNFPLLHHQWQIVESFKAQISQRTRERLMDQGLAIAAYADALAAVAVIDDLHPNQVLALFLDSRNSWISQNLGSCRSLVERAASNDVISVFCDVVRIIQITLAQVGELFRQVLNDMPLFYKTILGSPPGSQLFGGLPNPEEEVKLWKLHREKLESVMLVLEKEYVALICSNWLRTSREEVVSNINGKLLIDVIKSGKELASAERQIRDSLDSRKVLEGSLEWLRSVIGTEIESPWNIIRQLVLDDEQDLWDNIFEDAFVRRMKVIIDLGFQDLNRVVNVRESVMTINVAPGDQIDFQNYLNRTSLGGGVWFSEPNGRKIGTGLGYKATSLANNFLNSLVTYFGPEVTRIRDAVDSRCQSILEDLLCFLESQKAASRWKELATYLQNKCYGSVSTILSELDDELEHLFASLANNKESPVTIVERSLFIGRLLFALQNHSSNIPMVLGSPRLWANDTVASQFDKVPSIFGNSRMTLEPSSYDSHSMQNLTAGRKQTPLASTALFGLSNSASPKLELFSMRSRDLCIKAHGLWISWVSTELSTILSKDLKSDDTLSVTTSLKGWEETVIKQENSDEGLLEMKIALPSMPSLYVASFLFQACEEIHRVGGHALDKLILQKFASRLLEMVLSIYSDFISTLDERKPQVTERGLLQILLDLRFAVDILCGGDFNENEGSPKNSKSKPAYKQNHDECKLSSANGKAFMDLINILSQRLDPIDWATYEPYLWENEKQAYLRHAVLYGFFVQLRRLHTNTAPKLPSNTESNIMKCSTVPRFKYLPISAPEISSRGANNSILSPTSEDISSRSSWNSYANGELSHNLEFDDTSSFGAAALRSFMQVGTRFGESTLRLGSMLTDGQVGRLRDRSAAAMSTFENILPVQAAGILSSLTAGRSDL